MSAAIRFWDGDQWQDNVCTLLGFRYGPGNVQKVPSKNKGDLGIDAFILSHGHAYQCYAPQEPLTSEARYEKQRDKLTEDISKFIDNKDGLKKLFGSLLIGRWVFVVPLCDNRDLLAHAAGKVEVVLKASLPYVKDDFRILVEDEADFEKERKEAVSRGIEQLSLPLAPPAPELIVDWTEQNNELVGNLRTKLLKLNPTMTEPELNRRISEFITYLLQGENARSYLLAEHPELWEEINKRVRNREHNLAFLGGNPEATPNIAFRQEWDGFRAELKQTISPIADESADAIARGVLADWLARCPLDFK
jgi:hypothetical protein